MSRFILSSLILIAASEVFAEHRPPITPIGGRVQYLCVARNSYGYERGAVEPNLRQAALDARSECRTAGEECQVEACAVVKDYLDPYSDILCMARGMNTDEEALATEPTLYRSRRDAMIVCRARGYVGCRVTVCGNVLNQ